MRDRCRARVKWCRSRVCVGEYEDEDRVDRGHVESDDRLRSDFAWLRPCYALTLAKRLKAMGAKKYQNDGDPRTSGPGFGVTLHADVLAEPLRWRNPRTVFVNSMSDIAHARVPDEFVARVFAVMAAAEQHTFQVLTKRPRRLAKLLSSKEFMRLVLQQSPPGRDPTYVDDMTDTCLDDGLWPLDNVWIGTSIESDEYSWRADELRRAPAAIRFLSLEPLLGPLPSLDLTGIDWVIVGGEGGPEHRPLALDWARDIRDRCVDQGVALFFKQVGGRTPKAGGRQLDGRTWDQLPVRARAASDAGGTLTRLA
jgi:protein gp37